MIKKLIKKIASKLGVGIIPTVVLENPFTMAAALSRAAARGVKINTVIDVGASNGMWSQLCMQSFPDAEYLLIEAQEPHAKDLEDFVLKNNNAKYVLAAAGNRVGEIYFDNGGLFGGLASDKPFDKNCIKVPVTTIDVEIERYNLKPPFLIKLDTHGFEIPILEGAVQALTATSLLVIEEYNYKLTSDSFRHFEMSQYLEKKGFLSVDMVDLLLRQKDNTLWQMDVFYEPASSNYFNSNSYL